MASGPKLDGAGLAKMATLDEATTAVQRLHAIVERISVVPDLHSSVCSKASSG